MALHMARAIPIIKIYRTLLVSVQGELSDSLVLELKDGIGRAVAHYDVDSLIIELSGIDVLDSYIARSVRDLAQMSRLMGVRTVVTGLRPGMAATLVEMGMEMDGVGTALNLESALAMTAGLRQSRNGRNADWPGVSAAILDEGDGPS